MNPDSDPKSAPFAFSKDRGRVLISSELEGSSHLHWKEWKHMHFEEKIIYILRQCKIDENLLQKILKGGGPAKFDDIWWKQQILHLLPSDEAAEIAELLAKKRAFDSASVENPQFISIMEGAVYEMHKKHWDDAAMLTYIYKISPPGVQAILLKRIKQLDPFFQNKAVVVVWGVIIVLAVALWFYFNY